MNNKVTVYVNREETHGESWTVQATDESGYETGSVQIRRMTENKALAFIFGFVSEPEQSPEETSEILSALVGKIIANSPRNNIAVLQATAIAGSPNAEVLESLGFHSRTRFVNPNTGHTLRLYGMTLAPVAPVSVTSDSL